MEDIPIMKRAGKQPWHTCMWLYANMDVEPTTLWACLSVCPNVNWRLVFPAHWKCRWVATRKLGYDIFNCHKIIIPIHQNAGVKDGCILYHWVLVSVDMQEMKIFFYNSASGSGQNHKPGGLNILVRVCMLHIAIYMELIWRVLRRPRRWFASN